MIKEAIIHNGRHFAHVWRKEPPKEKICFYTENEDALQIGKHWYKSGDIIKPHRHIPVEVARTDSLQEVLYIEKGKVHVTFYSDDDKAIDQINLTAGDMILLMNGGHSFEFVEETEMIEIKQGPYNPKDTQKFERKQ